MLHRLRQALTGLAAAFWLFAAAAPAEAQQQAVCPDPPGNPAAGNRVLCEEDAASTDNIVIRVNGFDITAAERSHHGVWGHHRGNGDIDIDVTGGAIKVGKIPVTGDNGEAWGIAGVLEYNKAGRVLIDVSGVDIDTQGEKSFGVYGLSRGPGGVRIRVRDSTIDTKHLDARAVFGWANGAGRVDIGVTGGSFETADDYANGVRGSSYGAGDIVLDVRDAVIVTHGYLADGVFGWNWGDNSDGLIDIALSGRASVTTRGDDTYAVFGWQDNAAATKDVRISLVGETAVRTHGARARAVYGRNDGTDGDVDIGVDGGASVTTNGADAHGIYGFNSGTSSEGDIDIDVSDGASIAANDASATANDTSVTTNGANAHGIYGLNSGTSSRGDIDIDVYGGASVTTKGADAHGIYGLNSGIFSGGGIAIAVGIGSSVTTSGAGAHGIHTGIVGRGPVSAAVRGGASVRATGANASGIRFGRFNTTSMILERAAQPGEDRYRNQTATVNGSVLGGSGEAAGVYLSGGGKAIIGPKGAVGADSGIAILAARKLLSEGAPKLLVRLNLGGRRVGAVLGDDWIINDGGETTILVNGVKLHDGATGATGNTAVNGAWDVAIRRDGLTVDRRAPGNWKISRRSESTIKDRDFSAADFTETDNSGVSRPVKVPDTTTDPPAQITDPPARTPTPPTPPAPTPPSPVPPATPAPAPAGSSGGGAAFVGGALLALLLLTSFNFDHILEAPEAGTAPRPAFVRFADGETRYWTRGLSGPLAAAGGGTAGVEFGMDAGLGGGFWLGFAAAPDMAAGRAGGGASVSGGRYSLRGGWRSETLFAGLSASRADWEAKTAFAAPAGGLVAGAFDVRQTDLRLGAGARLALGGGASLAPKAEVFAGRLERGAQRAEGAAFRADVPETAQGYRGWKAGLGLASGWRDGPRGMKLRPALNLSALRTESRWGSFTLKQSDRLGIVETSVRARLADAPQTVLGLTAGVEAEGRGGLRMNFGYAAIRSPGGGIDHALAAGLNLRF